MNQKSFPSPQSNIAILPDFTNFFNQFTFLFELQTIGIPLYVQIGYSGNLHRELGQVSNLNQLINWHHEMADHEKSFDQVWCFKGKQKPSGSKSIGPTSLLLRQHPQKPYNVYRILKFCISFVTTIKSRHSPTIWKKLRLKLCRLTHFKSHRYKINLRVYSGLGEALSILDICMDFEPCFKVYHLVSLYHKSIKLGYYNYF